MNCESCGKPIKSAGVRGVEDPNYRYCKFCAPEGRLRGREDIREDWINALIEIEGLSAEEARKKVDSVMPRMPAWKNKE